MSLMMTLPDALVVHRIEDDAAQALDPPVHVDVAGADLIYAEGTDVVVELRRRVSLRFTMPDRAAALRGADTITKRVALAGR